MKLIKGSNLLEVLTGVGPATFFASGSGNYRLDRVLLDVAQLKSLNKVPMCTRTGVNEMMDVPYRTRESHEFQIMLRSLMPTWS